jgi:signal transduction histidine kinase
VTGPHDFEERMFQAEKMETVARLAGGLAHDVKNLLIGFSGVCEVAAGELDPGPSQLRDAIDQIKLAADRGAALTRQLLGLGRRQGSFEVVGDVNEVVRGIAGLVRRAAGEEVELVLDLRASRNRAWVETQRLEHALLNLAMNARDAMPSGGTLTIATDDARVTERRQMAEGALEPGDYLRISVADTGEGMDAETRSRALEPFFTTKPVGKGTGLGLSSVVGFVRRSEGRIQVESAPGRGTTVEIFFQALRPATR